MTNVAVIVFILLFSSLDRGCWMKVRRKLNVKFSFGNRNVELLCDFVCVKVILDSFNKVSSSSK